MVAALAWKASGSYSPWGFESLRLRMETSEKNITSRRVTRDPSREHECPRCCVRAGLRCRRDDGTVAPSSHSERMRLSG